MKYHWHVSDQQKSDETWQYQELREDTEPGSSCILPGEWTMAYPLSEQCGRPSKGEDASPHDAAVFLPREQSLEKRQYQTHDTERSQCAAGN